MELESLPEGWEMRKLEEIVEFFDHLRIPVNKKEREKRKKYAKQLYPYYGANGQIDWIDNFIFNGEYVLVAEDGGFWGPYEKTSYCVNGEFWVNNHAHILKGKEEVALNDFLELVLNTRDITPYISGTTRGKLTQTDVKRILIPLPPFEEQKQIVEILQFADYLKERRREAKELIDKIVMSVFYDMFGDPATNPKGWEVKEFGSIIEDIKSGFAYGKYKKEGGIPQLRPYNITEDGKLDLSTLKYVPETKKNIEGYYLKNGDMLFNNTNSPELVGKTTIFKSNLNCVFSNHLTRIRLDETKAVPTYIKQLFNYLWLKRVFQNGCHQWVNQAAINNKNLRELEILLPPLGLQQEFAEIVSKLEDKRKQMEEAEEKLEMLYQILLKQAFAGKLTEERRMKGNASKSS